VVLGLGGILKARLKVSHNQIWYKGMLNDIRAVVPTMPYHNTVVMVDWLCEAFGFQRRLIVKGEDGTVKHAELTFGESMIMVVPVQDTPFEKLVVHPNQLGGVETQTCYLVVSDVDAHYVKAKAKGAEIIFGVRVEDRGGRGYACRDPEGHMWMFGTYDPRRDLFPRPRVSQDPSPKPTASQDRQGSSPRPSGRPDRVGLGPNPGAAARGRQINRGASQDGEDPSPKHPSPKPPSPKPTASQDREDPSPRSSARPDRVGLAPSPSAGERGRQSKWGALVMLFLAALTMVSTTAAIWSYCEMRETTLLLDRITGSSATSSPAGLDHLAQEGIAQGAAEPDAKSLTAKLIEMKNAKESAEQSAKDLAARLAEERAARETAVRNGKEAQELLSQELKAKEVLVRAAQQAKDQLGQERVARETAEKAKLVADRSAKDAIERCEQDRTSRSTAERSTEDAMDQITRERNARAVAELAANELRNQLESIGSEPQKRISDLRNRIEVERRATGVVNRAVKDVQQQLAQEKYSRDAAERALERAQQKLAALPSCWTCPTAAPCERQ
jgi:uncharacterized glyoxalase superfamily protein PhnB